MNEENSAPSTKRRGRKPKGERPMTAAERKQLSRSKKAAEGSCEFMVRAGKGTLNFIDQFARASNISRSEVVQELLGMAIALVGIAVAEAEQLIQAGESEEVVAEHMRKRLNAIPAPDFVDQYKEVMGQ